MTISQRVTSPRQLTAAALFVAVFEVYFEVYGASVRVSGTGLLEAGVRRWLLTARLTGPSVSGPVLP